MSIDAPTVCRDADLPSCSPSGYRNGRPGKIRTVRQKPHFASEDRSWGAITPKGSSPSISTNFLKFLNVPPPRICGQRRLAWLEVVREPPPRRHPGDSNPPLSVRSESVEGRRCVSLSVYRESAANWPVRGADFKPSVSASHAQPIGAFKHRPTAIDRTTAAPAPTPRSPHRQSHRFSKFTG